MRFLIMLFLFQMVNPIAVWPQSDFQKEIEKVVLIASTTEGSSPDQNWLITSIIKKVEEIFLENISV